MLRYFYQDIIHPGVINSKQDNLTMIQASKQGSIQFITEPLGLNVAGSRIFYKSVGLMML